MPLADITAKDLTDLYRRWTCKREMTAKCFNNLKSIINGIYKYASSELGIAAYNPSKTIDMRQFPMKVSKKTTKTFSIMEKDKLVEHLSDSDDIFDLAILFDFQLTLRIGELEALRWDDVNGSKICIHSFKSHSTDMDDDLNFSTYEWENTNHIKGHSEMGIRTLHLTQKAQDILAKVREVNPDGEYIFMYDGAQLNTDTLNKRMHKYCKELGIEDLTTHAIRFFVASYLYQNGVSAQELQYMLGHTTLAMTLHYLRDVTEDTHTTSIMDNLL